MGPERSPEGVGSVDGNGSRSGSSRSPVIVDVPSLVSPISVSVTNQPPTIPTSVTTTTNTTIPTTSTTSKTPNSSNLNSKSTAQTLPHRLMTPARPAQALQPLPQLLPSQAAAPGAHADAYAPFADGVHEQEFQIDEDLSFVAAGRLATPLRSALCVALYVATGGAFYLLCRWNCALEVAVRTKKCPLQAASHVFIRNHWGEASLEPVRACRFPGGSVSDAFPQLFGSSVSESESAANSASPEIDAHAGSAATAARAEHHQPTSRDAPMPFLIHFEYRYFKFVLDPISGKFVPNYIWSDPRWQTLSYVLAARDSPEAITRKHIFFGPNAVDIKEKSTLRLLIDEVLHPFFVFQIASIILWSLDTYYYYAACILFISTTSAIATLVETKTMLRRMRDLSRFSCQIRYWRNGSWSYGRSDELVPGDLVELEPGKVSIVPCDAILLEGDCIINESMLTGESLAVSKTPATDIDIATLNFEEEEPASSSRMSRFFLFSGTEIIRVRPGTRDYVDEHPHAPPASPSVSPTAQHSYSSQPWPSSHANGGPLATRRGAVALVVRTGFNTTKGSLVRSMLFPRPNKFKFYQDSFRFIGVLAIISALGFLASMYNFIQLEMPWHTILVRALDLITIVVPPALPATLAIGTNFAIRRLRRGDIFCTSPPRVNICGKLNVMCFDKTGTLTQEGLDILGVRFTVPQSKKTDIPYEEIEANTPLRFSRLYRTVDAVMVKPVVVASPSIDYHHSSLSRASSPTNMRSPVSYTQSHSYSLPHAGTPTHTHQSNLSGASIFLANESGHPNAESDFPYPLIVCAMATCHSIKVVHGSLIGDPLDLKMFDFTGWHIEEDTMSGAATGMGAGSGLRRRTSRHASTMVVRPPWAPDFDTVVNGARNGMRFAHDDVYTELGVVRSFEFVSSLRRMSVIVRRMKYSHGMFASGMTFDSQNTGTAFGGHGVGAPTGSGTGGGSTGSPHAPKDLEVFVKGAPEVMRSICTSESVPPDYDEQLRTYTHHGYRVIACAWRKLEGTTWPAMLKMKRAAVECDLQFLGFIVFENKLKPGTTPVVRTLKRAGIRQIMCTGDSLLTSVSVSRECGLVDPSRKIFVPRFVEGEAHEAMAKIVWEDVDGSGATVDNVTLLPTMTHVSRSLPAVGGGGSNSASSSFESVGHQQASRQSAMPSTLSVLPRSQQGQMSSQQQQPSSSRSSVTGPLLRFARNLSAASLDSSGRRTGPPVPEHYDLAITGSVFQWMLDYASDETFERMLVKCQVFSRMSPDQKHFLVENLQRIGYCVGFCGDGTNDCGALKAADAGLSLSEAEASVAAPFTSKSKDLDCVLRVIREGRVALVTSFSCFKYMALYSLIQFTTVSLLYSIGQNVRDFQFMFIDIALIIPIAVFMGWAGPHPSIDRKRPTASLVSKCVLTSLIGQVAIQVAFQFSVFYWVRSQSWYTHGVGDYENQNYLSFENTALFLVSCFQYISVALVFTVGPPYQEPIWRNIPYIVTLVVLVSMMVGMTVYPTTFIAKLLGIVDMPVQGRVMVLVFGCANFVTSFLLERWMFPSLARSIGRMVDHVSFSRAIARRNREGVYSGGGGSNGSNGGGGVGGWNGVYSAVNASSGALSTASSSTAFDRNMKLHKWRKKGKLYKVIEQELHDEYLHAPC